MSETTIEQPYDLLRLCYQYKLQEVPVIKEGSITGIILKKDLVRILSQSDNFELTVKKTVDKLLNPVQDGFLGDLKEDLKSNEIKGIPLVSPEGNLKKVITPGVLRVEDDSKEFLDQSEELEFYENLLESVPFPIQIQKENNAIFKNDEWEDSSSTDSGWTLVTKEFDNFELNIRLPKLLVEVFESFEALENGKSIDIRKILNKIEKEYLQKSNQLHDSTSESAEHVGLPRQTFNYRWKNKVESSQNT